MFWLFLLFCLQCYSSLQYDQSKHPEDSTFILVLSVNCFQETGWTPCHIVVKDECENVLGVVPLYLKRFSIYCSKISCSFLYNSFTSFTSTALLTISHHFYFGYAVIPMVNLFLIILGQMPTMDMENDIIRSSNVVYLLLQ